jgi:hypothetical protein
LNTLHTFDTHSPPAEQAPVEMAQVDVVALQVPLVQATPAFSAVQVPSSGGSLGSRLGMVGMGVPGGSGGVQKAG